MASWEREGRLGREVEEEELLRRGRPSPGKRSLTHSTGSSFADLPPPGKVPATLSVSDESGGAAPDPAVRARVEATTGADLSAARVHTGPSSQANAAGLRARAFTVGSDIHFAAGQYEPGSPAGGHLLAHELVHTVQQRGGAPSAQLKSAEVSQEGDAAEVEADHIAGVAMSGAAARIAPVARAAPIARAPESLTGNPADLKDASGNPTTTHKSIGVGDAVNAPKASAAGTEARTTSVKPVATELAPLHTEGAVCPLDESIFLEDATASTPPFGYQSVSGFNGTTALPIVEQVASKSIYIGGKPTADDVQQGGIGDCNFMAAVVSIVSSDPGKITSMMAPDGNGGATVTFWRAQPSATAGGKRDWIQVAVTVDDQLAVKIKDNTVHGAQLRAAPLPRTQDWWAKVVPPSLEVHRRDTFEVARWAPLLEKAYARFAQSHDQYGGAHPGGKKGGSGYDAIFGGLGLEVMLPFYGPQMDDPANKAGFAVTTFTPGSGNSIVAANATVMEHLARLQGRKPDDASAPVVTVLTMEDALIRNLAAAIPVAQADPDYANVDPARQALVSAVGTSIATWQGLPPDPALPAAQPKAAAHTAIGTACVDAVRPGIDESTGEQTKLGWMRQWVQAPIQFAQNKHDLSTADADRMKNLHDELGRWASPVVDVHLDGHGSSEGSEAVNKRVSQERIDAVETAINRHGATPPHTFSKTAHGEEGASNDPSWRRVDVTITPTGHKTNSLLDDKRSQPIKDMAALMLNLRNLGTDSSQGQRNVYAGHAYAVLAVNIVTTDGKNVALNAVPAANRAALYPLVDPDVSTVTVRNPHHGNEPDWKDSNKPYRPGDGEPSSANADGVFTMSLRAFFRDFNSINSGVFPKS